LVQRGLKGLIRRLRLKNFCLFFFSAYVRRHMGTIVLVEIRFTKFVLLLNQLPEIRLVMLNLSFVALKVLLAFWQPFALDSRCVALTYGA
jgi:hypothetical protein